MTTGFDLEFERTDASTALATLAVDSDRLPDVERDVLDGGQVVTTHEASHPNRLVEHDGRYYTIQQTGIKQWYGDGGSFCSSSGDGFCDRADRHLWLSWAHSVGLSLLGVTAVAFGGWALLREVRSNGSTD